LRNDLRGRGLLLAGEHDEHRAAEPLGDEALRLLGRWRLEGARVNDEQRAASRVHDSAARSGGAARLAV
jgi:hypothetical protein